MSYPTKTNSDTGDDQDRAHGNESQRNIGSRGSSSGDDARHGDFPPIPSTLRAYYEPILGDLNDEINRPQLIALTSCKRGEGVSTVAVQLAIYAAQSELSVLLIDCNENNPCLHLRFGIRSSIGFRDFLKNGNTLDSIHATRVNNLSIMPYGRGRILPLPKIEFEKSIDSVQSLFDLVILDLPAIADSRHTIRWAASLENLLMVISNATSPSVAAKYKQRLVHAGAKLCGIVRNLH